MDRFFDLVTENARSAGAQTPKHTPDQSCGLIKLNANESVYGPSPKALAAMRAALENSNLYPDNDSPTLREKLAQETLRPSRADCRRQRNHRVAGRDRSYSPARVERNAVTSACSLHLVSGCHADSLRAAD